MSHAVEAGVPAGNIFGLAAGSAAATKK